MEDKYRVLIGALALDLNKFWRSSDDRLMAMCDLCESAGRHDLSSQIIKSWIIIINDESWFEHWDGPYGKPDLENMLQVEGLPDLITEYFKLFSNPLSSLGYDSLESFEEHREIYQDMKTKIDDLEQECKYLREKILLKEEEEKEPGEP